MSVIFPGAAQPLLLKEFSKVSQAQMHPLARVLLSPRDAVRMLEANAASVLVAIFTIVVGCLHPLATEASKTARVHSCTVEEDLVVACFPEPGRRAMPFHAATLSIAAEVGSLVATLVVIFLMHGSVSGPLKAALCPRRLLVFAPVGALYGLGDLLQTFACNAASGTVVMAVGQSKLLLTALFTTLMIKQSGSPNWIRLLVISSAACAATDVAAGLGAPLYRGHELYGAGLALLKAQLSALGAVWSELLYKKDQQCFFVLSFRVQCIMLMTSLLVLPMSALSWPSHTLQEFWLGGPLPLCSELLGQEVRDWNGSKIQCVNTRGWDRYTWLAVISIVLNGFSTGLTLKRLSAVSKSICNTLSAGSFFFFSIWLGYKPFSLAQACMFLIVFVSSTEYAVEKANVASSKRVRPRISDEESLSASTGPVSPSSQASNSTCRSVARSVVEGAVERGREWLSQRGTSSRSDP